jgi:hypothetical protein
VLIFSPKAITLSVTASDSDVNVCCTYCIILQTAGDSDEELLASSQQWAKDSLPQFLTALQQHAWELDKLYLPHPDWTAEW